MRKVLIIGISAVVLLAMGAAVFELFKKPDFLSPTAGAAWLPVAWDDCVDGRTAPRYECIDTADGRPAPGSCRGTPPTGSRPCNEIRCCSTGNRPGAGCTEGPFNWQEGHICCGQLYQALRTCCTHEHPGCGVSLSQTDGNCDHCFDHPVEPEE